MVLIPHLLAGVTLGKSALPSSGPPFLKPVAIAFQYHGAPLYYTDLLSDCNLVFTILFTIECVMKVGCFGPKVRNRERERERRAGNWTTARF